MSVGSVCACPLEQTVTKSAQHGFHTRPRGRFAGLLIPFVLLLALPVGSALAAPGPLPSAVARHAEAAGLTGDDLSPAVSSTDPGLPEPMRKRPEGPGDVEIAQESPAVRVHVDGALAARLADSDFDGVPDRAAAALRVAVRALSVCRNLDIGLPADDGDGEVDVFLEDLDGAARGYVVLERPAPPGRGASGFAVVDASAAHARRDVLAMVARSVARLSLAARDASAPAWWVEPSAVWLESRVTGVPRSADAWLEARWNHPERGLTTRDPLLARGNVSLLWSLRGDDGGDELAEQLLAASWRRLAKRAADVEPFEALDRTARAATGLGLMALQERAAASRIARGRLPARWGANGGQAGRLTLTGLPVSGSGLAQIHLAPGEAAGTSPTTEISLRAVDGPWQATLLVRRSGGTWDRTRLTSTDDGVDDRFEAEIPWRDYREAVLLLSRAPEADGAGSYKAEVTTDSEDRHFALSSLSAVLVGNRTVELRWSTAGEHGLFGWFVERSAGPRGPWTRVGIAPVPSLGLERSGSSYRVVDEDPAAGPDAFYRVVALTRHGLRISGPVVSVGR